jgi:hypothetical protein
MLPTLPPPPRPQNWDPPWGAVHARPPVSGSRTQIHSKAPDFDARQDHPSQRALRGLRGLKLFARRGCTVAEECRQFASEVRPALRQRHPALHYRMGVRFKSVP